MNNLTAGIAAMQQWHTANLCNPRSEKPEGTVWQTINYAIDKDQLHREIDAQGGLTSSQLQRLTHVFNTHARLVSNPFGRQFHCSSSALVTVDNYGHPDSKLQENMGNFSVKEITNQPSAQGSYEKAILMHIRADNDKLALTGGGFPDLQETCAQAIAREVHEETGGGCTLEQMKLVGIWDTRRGGPEHRISVIFEGSLSGMPKTNHEAKRFFFVREQDLPLIPDTLFFASHGRMIKRHFTEPKSTNDAEIDFVGRANKLEPQKIAQIESDHAKSKSLTVSPYVEYSIKMIESLYAVLHDGFADWSKYNLGENFEKSRDAIPGWSKKSEWIKDPSNAEAAQWNDDKQLWNFLEGFKMAAVKISNFFKTHITTGECGVIEQAMLIEQASPREEKVYVVLKSKGKYSFPVCEHRHGEGFKEILYREALKQLEIRIQDNVSLVKMYENSSHRNSMDIPLRTFVFKMITEENPMPNIPDSEVTLMSAKELRNLPAANFTNPHHKQFIPASF